MPNFIILYCPYCKEEMSYGYFGMDSDFLGINATCPYCGNIFDFGKQVSDVNSLKTYRDIEKESSRDKLLGNTRRFIKLYASSPLFEKTLRNKKIESLWWLNKLIIKRKCLQEIKSYAEIKDLGRLRFYRDLLTIIENKDLHKEPDFGEMTDKVERISNEAYKEMKAPSQSGF